MGLVENAWGVFGAAFGPVILLSLFWRRFTFSAARWRASWSARWWTPALLGTCCCVGGVSEEQAPSKEIEKALRTPPSP